MNSPDFSPDELHACALALKLAAAAFYLAPSKSFLTMLNDDALLVEWPLAPDSPVTVQGLELLRLALADAHPDRLLRQLRSDYTALFVGLEQVGAPPWESVYLSHDHLLFEEQTLAVRDFYARFGLQIPKVDREPDDHIGYELLFLAHLLEEAARLAAEDQPQQVQVRMEAAREFLDAHPQQWAGEFTTRVLERATTDYYRGWALLLTGSLLGLAALLARQGPESAAADPRANGAAT